MHDVCSNHILEPGSNDLVEDFCVAELGQEAAAAQNILVVVRQQHDWSKCGLEDVLDPGLGSKLG